MQARLAIIEGQTGLLALVDDGATLRFLRTPTPDRLSLPTRSRRRRTSSPEPAARSCEANASCRQPPRRSRRSARGRAWVPCRGAAYVTRCMRRHLVLDLPRDSAPGWMSPHQEAPSRSQAEAAAIRRSRRHATLRPPFGRRGVRRFRFHAPHGRRREGTVHDRSASRLLPVVAHGGGGEHRSAERGGSPR